MPSSVPSFRDALSKALVVAWAADAEHAQLRSRFDSETDPEYRATPRLKFDRLTNFLFQLPEAHLQKLQSIVAAGRGEETVVGAYGKLKRLRAHRDAIIRGLVARLPLSPYLRQGIRAAQDEGLDLDATW